MGASRALTRAGAAGLTYREVGATAGALPAGYRHVRRSKVLGTGMEVFDAAAELVMTWQMHRRGGLVVEATAPRAREGDVVVLGLGIGRLRVHAPCRVVLVIAEPGRRGFVYGTLQGHPESGEERFEVSIDQKDRVHLTITAFSRPATWWSGLGGPVSRRVQDLITDGYVNALAGRA